MVQRQPGPADDSRMPQEKSPPIFSSLEDVPFHQLDAAVEHLSDLFLRHTLDAEENERQSLLLREALKSLADRLLQFVGQRPAFIFQSDRQSLSGVRPAHLGRRDQIIIE